MGRQFTASVLGILIVLGALTACAGAASADVKGNDNFDHAEPAGGEGSISGSVGTFEGSLWDEADIYKVNMPAGKKVTFTCENNGQHPLCFDLYDHAQGHHDGRTAPAGGRVVLSHWNNNTPNHCFIEITAMDTGTEPQPFSITVNFTSQNDAGSGGDAADSLATATPVEFNTNYTGLLRDNDGRDYYMFKGTRGYDVTVNFNMTEGEDSMDSVLYNNHRDFNSEASFIRLGHPYDYGIICKENGTYYVEFNRNLGWAGYTFNLTSEFVLDFSPPEITVYTPEDGSVVYDGTIDLSGTAEDDVCIDSIQVSLDGENWSYANGTEEWNYDDLELEVGDNVIAIVIRDLYGNNETVYIDVKYVPEGSTDGTDPVVRITSPANGTTVATGAVDLAGTASDDTGLLKVEVSLDGLKWRNASGTTGWTFGGLALRPGNNTVQARATDPSGNTGHHSIRVRSERAAPGNDTMAPWINITSPVNGSRLLSPDTSVSGAAGDNVGVARVEVRLDGGPWFPAAGTGAWSFRAQNLTTGNHTIEARATDAAGLAGSAIVKVRCEPEAVPPGVVIVSHANNSAVSTDHVTVTGRIPSTMNISAIELYVNGEKANVTLKSDGNWSATVKLKPGKNSIDTVAHDMDGDPVTNHFVLKYNKPGTGPKPPIPGPGLPALAAAIAAGALLLARKRRA